jgi:hypothetical protein
MQLFHNALLSALLIAGGLAGVGTAPRADRSGLGQDRQQGTASERLLMDFMLSVEAQTIYAGEGLIPWSPA